MRCAAPPCHVPRANVQKTPSSSRSSIWRLYSSGSTSSSGLTGGLNRVAACGSGASCRRGLSAPQDRQTSNGARARRRGPSHCRGVLPILRGRRALPSPRRGWSSDSAPVSSSAETPARRLSTAVSGNDNDSLTMARNAMPSARRPRRRMTTNPRAMAARAPSMISISITSDSADPQTAQYNIFDAFAVKVKPLRVN